MFAVTLSVLQTWIVIELFFMIGTDGPNRFGSDPTRRPPKSPVVSHPQSLGVPDFLCSVPARPGVRRMDYFWYLFSFEGRINRARNWQALLIVIGIGVCWIMFFGMLTIGVASMLGATGPASFSLGTEEILKLFDPAFYRTLALANLPIVLFQVTGSMLILWIFFATSIKRLHDRDKSAWWMIPFFLLPGCYDQCRGVVSRRLRPAGIAWPRCIRSMHLGHDRAVFPQRLAKDQPVRCRPARADRYAARLGPAKRDRNGAAQG